MQSSPRKEKSKRRKKIEKQKVKMYIFSTEYIFLKPKDQTNELEQKNKRTIEIKMYIYTANIDLYLFFICF